MRRSAFPLSPVSALLVAGGLLVVPFAGSAQTLRAGSLAGRQRSPETLPLVLYDECSPTTKLPFAYSGWMGDTDQIEFDPCWPQDPHSGKHCIRFSFLRGAWGGIAWQFPANDWGDDPDALNLSGARALRFWARGEKGSEQVKFSMGIIGRDKQYPDSGSASVTVLLSKKWRRYTLSVQGKDLRRIKTGFAWSVQGKGAPVTFFVDDVQYE